MGLHPCQFPGCITQLPTEDLHHLCWLHRACTRQSQCAFCLGVSLAEWDTIQAARVAAQEAVVMPRRRSSRQVGRCKSGKDPPLATKRGGLAAATSSDTGDSISVGRPVLESVDDPPNAGGKSRTPSPVRGEVAIPREELPRDRQASPSGGTSRSRAGVDTEDSADDVYVPATRRTAARSPVRRVVARRHGARRHDDDDF